MAVTDARAVARMPSRACAGSETRPAIEMSCLSSGLVIRILFAEALEDAFPDGRADVVRVAARLDSNRAQTLAFVPSSDWRSVYSIDQSSVAANLQDLAVKILGGLVPGAQGLNASWKAEELARDMDGAERLTVRVPTRSGTPVTAVFDLRTFSNQFRQLPNRCQ